MKSNLLLLVILFMSFNVFAFPVCGGNANITKGIEPWPWSLTKPFPWDNIQGFWQLGDDSSTYLKARVLSSTPDRKILALTIHTKGICSKPTSKGIGYILVAEKNVVKALVSDGTYKYQLKLGMFDSQSLGMQSCTKDTVVAMTMQVVGYVVKSTAPTPAPLDPQITEIYKMLLKKVTADPTIDCNLLNK
jgi:hypothetical protein